MVQNAAIKENEDWQTTIRIDTVLLQVVTFYHSKCCKKEDISLFLQKIINKGKDKQTN